MPKPHAIVQKTRLKLSIIIKSITWRIVRNWLDQNGYELLRPTGKPLHAQDPTIAAGHLQTTQGQ